MTRLRTMIALCLTVATAVVEVAANAQTTASASKQVIALGNSVTPFPIGFLGHPWAYAFAVFSQLTIFSFAAAIFFLNLNALDLKRDRCMRNGKSSWQSAINVYRVKWLLIMFTIICGVSSNLLIYLSWGEVTTKSMEVILTVDKMVKGFAMVPFCSAMYLFVANQEHISGQLIMNRTCPDPIWPIAPEIKDHAKTIFIVLLITGLVTVAKYYGLNR